MGNIFAPLSIGARPDIELGIWGVPPNILVVAQNLILGVHLVLETVAPIKLNFKYHTYNAPMAVCSVAVFFLLLMFFGDVCIKEKKKKKKKRIFFDNGQPCSVPI